MLVHPSKSSLVPIYHPGEERHLVLSMPTPLLLNTSREERRLIDSSAFIFANNPDPTPTTGYFLTSSQLLLIVPWSTYPQANSGIWVECQKPDFTIIVSVATVRNPTVTSEIFNADLKKTYIFYILSCYNWISATLGSCKFTWIPVVF